MEILSFEEWFDLNEDDINIELEELGADKELDFDSEKEFYGRYEKYRNTINTINTINK